MPVPVGYKRLDPNIVHKEERAQIEASIVDRFTKLAHIRKKYGKLLYRAFCEAIYDALMEGEKVVIPGVGKFYFHVPEVKYGIEVKTGKFLVSGKFRKVTFTFTDRFKNANKTKLIEKFGWELEPVYSDTPIPLEVQVRMTMEANGHSEEVIQGRLDYLAKRKTKQAKFKEIYSQIDAQESTEDEKGLEEMDETDFDYSSEDSKKIKSNENIFDE